jgi:hypothetical protein
MDKVKRSYKMEIIIKVNFRMENFMDMEQIFIRMEEDLKAFTKKENIMVSQFTIKQME